jgi:hypothetical protein
MIILINCLHNKNLNKWKLIMGICFGTGIIEAKSLDGIEKLIPILGAL